MLEKPIITEVIPQQNFEIVSQLIAAILCLEVDNQKKTQNFKDEHSVFSERITSVDKSEGVVLNVLFDSLTLKSKTEQTSQNTASFFVDVYATGKANPETPGDEVSARKILKYAGICRYILQSHKYKTLDLPLGCIGGTSVDSINMFEQQNTQDGGFSRMCRLVFSVRLTESEKLWSGVLLDDQITNVKLHLTEKGYQYKIKE